MEIFGSILIGIFVILLFGLGIMGCGFLIREIWGIVKDRKSNRVSYEDIVIAAIENQVNLRNTPAVPTTLPSTVDTGTLAPQYREDLAYLKAYSRSRLKDRSLILSESKKEITPPVEEERKLEYTGIRAIQL